MGHICRTSIWMAALCWMAVCTAPVSAQPTSFSGSLPVFVDSQEDTIPSNPANLPFKLVEGYAEYIVSPGDILEITTVEPGQRTIETARILPDGTLSFSILNNVPVRGLSLSEVVQTLSRTLSRYVRNPQIQVLVKEYLSKSVSVFGSITGGVTTLTGERTGPGVYPLKGRITALEQILQVGGPTPDARLDQIRLIRANRTYILDLQRAITTGDNSQNVILEHGDVLQVTGITQADRRVAVFGEVTLPGIFNLSSQANILEVVAASQGFTGGASERRIRVIRTSDPTNPEIFTVDANRIMKGDLTQNIGLEDGDIVVVQRDVTTSISSLLDQLSPFIRFGGIVTTAPVLTVGGFDINTPQAGGVTIEPGTTTGGLTIPIPTSETQVIQQVQRNLRGDPLRKPAVTEK